MARQSTITARSFVVWRIAPGRLDTPVRTADAGSEETRGLVCPQDPCRQFSGNHVAWRLAAVLLARANYLLSRATSAIKEFRAYCLGTPPQSIRVVARPHLP
jgi:hypothetical protein